MLLNPRTVVATCFLSLAAWHPGFAQASADCAKPAKRAATPILPVIGTAPETGVVGFVGAGTVAPTVSDLANGTLFLSYGLGLRALKNAAQRSAIRIDYGLGKGSSGLYVALGQAF